MHIRQYLSSSPRLTRPWRLALVSVLLIGLFLPQSALAASTWANTAPHEHRPRCSHGDAVAQRQGAHGRGTSTVVAAAISPVRRCMIQARTPGRLSRRCTLRALITRRRCCRTARCSSWGAYSNDVLASAEVYDPSADTWTRRRAPEPPRAGVTRRRCCRAARCSSREALAAVGGYLASAEVYDPERERLDDRRVDARRAPEPHGDAVAERQGARRRGLRRRRSRQRGGV